MVEPISDVTQPNFGLLWLATEKIHYSEIEIDYIAIVPVGFRKLLQTLAAGLELAIIEQVAWLGNPFCVCGAA